MSTLSRYVLGQWIRVFLLTAVGLPFVAILTQLTDNLRRLLANALTPGTIALSYVYALPQNIAQMMPAACLFAAVFTVGPVTPALSGAGQTKVGSYALGASNIAETSANFSNTLTVVGNLSVAPKALTASATGGVSKVYDGNTSMSGVTLGLNTLVSGDAVTVGAPLFALDAELRLFGRVVLEVVDAEADHLVEAGQLLQHLAGGLAELAGGLAGQRDAEVALGEVVDLHRAEHLGGELGANLFLVSQRYHRAVSPSSSCIR